MALGSSRDGVPVTFSSSARASLLYE